MARPDHDVASYLETNIGALTLGDGGNLFARLPAAANSERPGQVVYCYGAGGFPPDPTVDGTNHVRHPTVGIRVRGAKDKHEDAGDLAQLIRDTLQQASITGYQPKMADCDEPTRLGDFTSGRAEWSINVDLRLNA